MSTVSASPSSVLKEIKRLSSHSALYGIAGVGSAAVGTILVPLYGHLLTPAEFGQLQLAQLWLSLAATVAGLGLNSAYFKAYHQYTAEPERRQTLGVVLSLLGLSAGMTCAVFLGLAAQSRIDHFAPLRDPSFLLLFLACLVGGVGLPLPFQLLRAQERPLHYLRLAGLGMVVNLSLNLLWVWRLAHGVRGVLAAQALSALAVLALATPRLASNLRLSLSRERALELLRFGMPLVPATLALWVLEGSDRIVLEQFWGASEVGIYSLGYKYASLLQFALVAFQLAWTPYLFSVAQRPDAPQLISRILTFFIAALMTFATLLYALRDKLLPLLAQEAFAGAGVVVAPVLLGFLFYGIYFITTSGTYLHGKTGSVALLVGLAALLNLGLNLLLIPPWGGAGAAWATALSYLALAVSMYRFSRRYLPLQLEWRPLSLSALCCLAVAQASDQWVLVGWTDWLARLLAVALIPPVLWGTGLVTAEERRQIAIYLRGGKEGGER